MKLRIKNLPIQRNFYKRKMEIKRSKQKEKQKENYKLKL